jgi:histidinol-phosphate aminotransferase
MPEPRKGLRDTAPYGAPQLDVPVRLNTNECPYDLPEGFLDDLAREIRGVVFNRYPDRDAVALREAIAAHVGHPAAGVWAANGSNEIIQQLLQAYGGPGRRAVLFRPTYVLYDQLLWTSHTDVVTVDTPEPFVIGDDQIGQAVASGAEIAFVCSPNNPTGNTQRPDVVRRLAAETDALVIVDEAYIEFGGETAAGLVSENANVVVVRTFSKAFALAGARIGYCLASPEVVDDLQRVRLPYHLSALTQATGRVALRYTKESLSILDALREQRDRIVRHLSGLPGVVVFPSESNFVLFRPPGDPGETWRALLDRGVLVRDMSTAVPGCLRVSSGTPEEIDRFLEALEEVVA